MTNQEIIEKLYRLQILLKTKNPPIANALERVTIPLLEYDMPLDSVSREDVLKIKGVGKVTADLLMQIIHGKHFFEIASSVPKMKKKAVL